MELRVYEPVGDRELGRARWWGVDPAPQARLIEGRGGNESKPKIVDPARYPGPVVTAGSDGGPVVASGVSGLLSSYARAGGRGVLPARGGLRSLRPAHGG